IPYSIFELAVSVTRPKLLVNEPASCGRTPLIDSTIRNQNRQGGRPFGRPPCLSDGWPEPLVAGVLVGEARADKSGRKDQERGCRCDLDVEDVLGGNEAC